MQTQWQSQLRQATDYANSARNHELLAVCQQVVAVHPGNADALLEVGSLLLNFGFLSRAKECFDRVRVLSPNDQRAVINLANIARDSGDHALSRQVYAELLRRLPDNPVIRRNVLVSLQYDPAISDSECLAQA